MYKRMCLAKHMHNMYIGKEQNYPSQLVMDTSDMATAMTIFSYFQPATNSTSFVFITTHNEKYYW